MPDSVSDGAKTLSQQEGNQGVAMTRYIARFMKNVLGENGHEAEICQRTIEVEAKNRVGATDAAKVKFCETENVKDWCLRADRVQIAETEFLS
jgi:hypothetical protein